MNKPKKRKWSERERWVRRRRRMLALNLALDFEHYLCILLSARTKDGRATYRPLQYGDVEWAMQRASENYYGEGG